MTRIAHDPETFVDDALEGFARAYPGLVRRIDGGIVRAHPIDEGRVAVVAGGGSGHYPAFAGFVGAGLAAGAVCGNIFSSPSTRQAVRVAREVHAGGGVLFSYGNYAGDVIHFGAAERELRDAGIDARTVLVTDDIASAPADDAGSRRGIAGDLCVFKIAGAAAQEGTDLDGVERLARRANSRTRSLGVAFGGCTLPGAPAPLFSVPEGSMSVGLGIHGEPGVRDVPLQSAPDLARTLIEPLLAERPAGSDPRAALLVNGLGTVKYEELFVLFRHITDILEAEGIEIVEPLCGELVTSLDMAGVSATLMWLDDDLERLWRSPASSPAFTRGDVSGDAGRVRAVPVRSASEPVTARPSPPTTASDESRRAAALARELIPVARDAIAARVDDLGDLDAIAGDGDHGVGMLRGIDAAAAEARTADAAEGVDELLIRAGAAWADRAGGTSGALWGAALESMGSQLGSSPIDPRRVADAVSAGRRKIAELGGAKRGDKTLMDALVPFDEEFRRHVEDGADIPSALRAAADAAGTAAQETAALTPRLGRARPLAERSVGHPDPGAVSFAIIVAALSASGVEHERTKRRVAQIDQRQHEEEEHE